MKHTPRLEYNRGFQMNKLSSFTSKKKSELNI